MYYHEIWRDLKLKQISLDTHSKYKSVTYTWINLLDNNVVYFYSIVFTAFSSKLLKKAKILIYILSFYFEQK